MTWSSPGGRMEGKSRSVRPHLGPLVFWTPSTLGNIIPWSGKQRGCHQHSSSRVTWRKHQKLKEFGISMPSSMQTIWILFRSLGSCDYGSKAALKLRCHAAPSTLISVTLSSGFPSVSAGKESICNAWDLGWIFGLGRSPGEGSSYLLQYSGLENSMGCIFNLIITLRAKPSQILNEEPCLVPNTLPGLSHLILIATLWGAFLIIHDL